MPAARGRAWLAAGQGRSDALPDLKPLVLSQDRGSGIPPGTAVILAASCVPSGQDGRGPRGPSARHSRKRRLGMHEPSDGPARHDVPALTPGAGADTVSTAPDEIAHGERRSD